MGKNSFYLGDVGNASKMNLILQMMAGVSVAAIAEALSLGNSTFNFIFNQKLLKNIKLMTFYL